MWHAARVQEKAIKTMLIDYQKRADRRRIFYEQMKQEPTNFLQLFGRPAKINLDSTITIAAESPQIMQAWQGNTDIIIDRYDVRSHIDFLPLYNPSQHNQELTEDETRCNYERFRILVQNDAAGVTEDDCLKQIYMDEQFGAIPIPTNDNKKGAEKKAAIGYNYNDEGKPAQQPQPLTTPASRSTKIRKVHEEEDDDDEDSSDGDMDLDNILDIDLLTTDQEIYLDKIAVNYDIKNPKYSDFLEMDRSEIEEVRMARLIEQEKAQYSGRKSRRERRIYKEKKLKERQISPPSYATYDSVNKKNIRCSTSRSHSPVQPHSSNATIEFITSFGGDAGHTSSRNHSDQHQLELPHGPFLPGSEEEILYNERQKAIELLKEAEKEPPRKVLLPTPKIKAKSPSISLSRRTASRRNRSSSRIRGDKSKNKQSISKSSKKKSTSSRSKSRSPSTNRRKKYKTLYSSSASSSKSRSNSRAKIRRRFKESKSDSRDRGRFKRSRSKNRRRFKEEKSRSKNRWSRSRSRNNGSGKVIRSRSIKNSRSRCKVDRLRNSRSFSRSRSLNRQIIKVKSSSSSTSSRSKSKSVEERKSLKRYRRSSLSSHSGLEEEDDEEGDGKDADNDDDKKSTARNRFTAGLISKRLGKVDQTSSKVS